MIIKAQILIQLRSQTQFGNDMGGHVIRCYFIDCKHASQYCSQVELGNTIGSEVRLHNIGNYTQYHFEA